MLFRTSKSAPEIPWCSAVSAAHQKCSHKGIYPGKQYADARISRVFIVLNIVKNAPEVHSLEESLSILEKYRDKIPSYSYGIAASIIKNNAIEDLYLNETAITAILVCNSYKTVAEKEKFIEEYVEDVKKEYSDAKA